MKSFFDTTKGFIILWMVVFFVGCSSNGSGKGETKSIQIDSEVENTITYELGVLKMDDQKELTLQLQNLLQVPVVVNDIKGFCGCTMPRFDKEPILPGRSSEVSIIFMAHQTGIFNKELKMYLSSQDKPVSIIFNGEIVKR
ncbi:DUF1573 domain-containing protein [Prolixibacteraceae bacterium Z1-6]|uniref:DUF1573 domain-containing protein n=1 Tax=Draconibacterium aestuarii TaxID=2998507 RepID=A0A9X3FHT6_9BACT|nr:DUF1573 domain-containing protein [Prolixibacteraceae bacterium Z1-6]